MAEQLLNISVIEPITPAFERVKIMLFRPFDLGRWFAIGFCAWLAYLGQGGFNFHFNFPFDAFKKDNKWPSHDFDTVFNGFPPIATWFTPVVITLVIIGIVIGLVIGIILVWLSSRGRFMFLHCTATNKAEVAFPWHRYKRQGNSLFVFRIVVGIINIISLAIIAGIITAAGFIMHHNGVATWIIVVSLIFISLITFVPTLIAFAVFMKFTNDFVIPIMFLRDKTAVEAWRELLGLLGANKGGFTLYILFQIVIAMAIGVLVLTAATIACCACCCTVCIWSIPYISTVILLPVLAFKLAYSLNYLRQFGPDYDVFIVPTVEAV